MRDGHPQAPWFLRSTSRLVLGLAVGMVLPVAILAALIVVAARRSLEDQARARNSIAARLGAEAVSEHLRGVCRYVEGYAERSTLAAAARLRDVEGAEAVLGSLVEGAPELDRAFITDAAGIGVADFPRSGQLIGRSGAHRDWFRGVTTTGRTYVSNSYVRDASPRVRVIAIATRLRTSEGLVAGYLVVHHRVDVMTRRMLRLAPSDTGWLALVDSSGRVADRRMSASDDAPTIDVAALTAGGAREGSYVGEDPVSHDESQIAFAHTNPGGWLVLALERASDVYAPSLALSVTIGTCALICAALAAAAGISALRSVRRYHVALAELDESRQLLAGMIVHDLRNPLTATQGWIELARSHPNSDANVAECLGSAAAAARSIQSLADTLVDVMRLEDGRMPFAPSCQDLAALALECVDEFRAAAQERSVALAVDCTEPLVLAQADPDLVRRVLENLVTNALKHTPQGGTVTISARSTSATAVELSVRDTGEGIAPGDLPRLFQKYACVQGQRLGSRRDTGLGLVFVRMAVERQGGRVSVDSRLGHGSTFHVELPRATAEHRPPEPAAPPVARLALDRPAA